MLKTEVWTDHCRLWLAAMSFSGLIFKIHSQTSTGFIPKPFWDTPKSFNTDTNFLLNVREKNLAKKTTPLSSQLKAKFTKIPQRFMSDEKKHCAIDVLPNSDSCLYEATKGGADKPCVRVAAKTIFTVDQNEA